MEYSSTNKKKHCFLVTTVLPLILQQNGTLGEHSLKSIERSKPIIGKANAYDSFTCFPNLPAEIRLKIWSKASDTSLIIDLWTEFRKCEVTNSVLYYQYYGTKLTDTHTRVLQVNRESREQSLKCLPLEFGTKIVQLGMEVGHDANIRINWECDVFLPRGYWNMVAFEDFMQRCVGSMRRLAIDPTTSFWTDELKKYVSKGIWPFIGVEEVTLYDATGMKVFKPQFFERPMKNLVKFDFVDAEPSTVVTNAQIALNDCFDKVDKMKRLGLTDEEHAIEKKTYEDKFLTYVPAFVEQFQRPRVRLMKLHVAENQKI